MMTLPTDSRFLCLLTLFGLLFVGQTQAEQFIVKDGQPMAEIVVPERPSSMVRYAALELQAYIEKMSGAKLPIFPPEALAPVATGSHLLEKYPVDLERKPIRIYVGESWHTDRLGVTDAGLEWGAYRLQSGDGWLVLLGNDSDFTPRGVWGRHRGHMNGAAQEEWQAAIGDHHWGNPMGKIWFKYNSDLDLWSYDQKGTLNAVYGFLRDLGVRWYMPGELGEIVPRQTTIAIPEVDTTVVPEIKVRKMAFSKYALGRGYDDMLWCLRLGVNDPYGYHTYHGLAHITNTPYNRANHPEFYALYDGKRDSDARTPNPCLSSQRLFDETVEYVRFVFDMFEVPAISVWPDDGFTKICECELCAGKDTPDRGGNGKLSDYVWDFVNRVAVEVAKTHPDKLVMGGAYSTYWLPPAKLTELSPNVAVHIVNARRRYNLTDEELASRREAVRQWSELTDGKVVTFMNYGGAANTPHLFAEDIKAYKGLVMGEDMWPPFAGGALAMPGFTHLNYYLSARLWWDIDRDVEAMLDEYYSAFYGPAAAEMEAFINYYELHQQDFGPVEKADQLEQAVELFAAAEQAVDPDSIYGQRVAMFAEGVERLKLRYSQISLGRTDVPSYRAVAPHHQVKDIVFDGKLNEHYWKYLHGRLRDNISGDKKVAYPTRFRIGPHNGYLYMGILCRVEPGQELNATTTQDDDPAIWEGDYIDILLETPTNSYYQISINPAGAVADLDRSVEGDQAFRWDSKIEVFMHHDKEQGIWTLELKVPYTASDQDPLHEVIGTTPSRKLPWFFNICRQQKRADSLERTAFSPTGEETFHEILKFGQLHGK